MPLTEDQIASLMEQAGQGAVFDAGTRSALASRGVTTVGGPTTSPSAQSSPADPFAGYSWMPTGTGHELALRGPNGQTVRVDAGNYQEVDRLTRSGWLPLNQQGNPYQVASYKGGQMFYDPDRQQWMPVNVLLGGGWLDVQRTEMPNFLQWAGTQNLPTGGVPGDAYAQPPGAGNAYPAGGGLPDFPFFETPSIGRTELPETQTVNRMFGQDFDNQYADYLRAQGREVGGFYDFDPAQMTAAQHNLSGIPQVTAQTPEMFDALQFLLRGKGFDDPTLTRMRSMATDDISRVGAAQRGATRLAAEQAGISGTPAALAMEGQSMRRQGDAQTRALNEIEVQNALQGIQNMTTGAGMELNRQTSGAQMTNATALQNAANMIAAMQQNIGNLQQQNLVNTQNEVGRQMTQAGEQAQTFNQGSQAYNQAALGRARDADFYNATAQNTRNFTQAEMDRDADKFDVGNQMTRYGWDTANLVNLANMTGANNLYGQGTSLTPYTGGTSNWASVLRDIGRGIWNPQPAGATV